MFSRTLPWLFIAVLGLAFFWPLVLHPTEILYADHSDFLAFHLPAKWFLVSSYQETGEIPLWNPYTFGGMPFVADHQSSAFYPFHLPLYFMPHEWIGPALSWIIVLHVLIAGWTMYAYARSQGLGIPGSLVAAFGFMFAGKWHLNLLASGGYNVIPLAWLPLVLLLLERAIRRGSFACATWAGAVFSLLILACFPQIMFYAGLVVAAWTLIPALEYAGYLGGEGPRSRLRTLTGVSRWAGFGGWAAAIAVALSLVQLWPSLELAREATRFTGVDWWEIIKGVPRALIGLVGSPFAESAAYVSLDDRGGCGIIWLTLAICAPLLGGKRVRAQAVICLLLFLYVFGGAVLFQGLPGFRYFRMPSRMLLPAALPVALLAGSAVQQLLNYAAVTPERLELCRKILLRTTIAVLILAVGYGIRLCVFEGLKPTLPFYWITLLATVPAAYELLGKLGARTRLAVWLWPAILLTELWSQTYRYVGVRPEAAIYPPSAIVAYLSEHREPAGRVLAVDSPEESEGLPKTMAAGAGDAKPKVNTARNPFGAGEPLAFGARLESLRGFNPYDVRRSKEYLHLIEDGNDELRPLGSTLTFPIVGDFPLTNKPLLDLLNVRYLAAPADAKLDAVWERRLEDPKPVAYGLVSGGLMTMPPYVLYENSTALPRAFVVHEAAPLPDRRYLLETMKNTNFRRRVLLEDFTGKSGTLSASSVPRAANIASYQPNEIRVHVEDGPDGYLVLGDVWFPGWTATIDGQPAKLYRANYTFRAIKALAGTHEVVFRYEPEPYRVGKLVSLAAVAVVGALTVVALVLRRPCLTQTAILR